MSFLETPRFPDGIAYNSAGGPGYNTRVIDYGAGFEARDILWSYGKHEYDAAYGVRKIEDLYDVVAFFHSVKGMGHGFRFKDHVDYKSCAIEETIANTDQTIGTGDDSETEFQLIKTYTSGVLSTVRYITKPVLNSIVISLDDVSQSSGWSADTTTGIVTFVTPPGDGVVVKAGYEFDVPVRFASDKLNVIYADYQAGQASIPIVEIKNQSVPG